MKLKSLILLLAVSINGFSTNRDIRKEAMSCKNYETQGNWPTGHNGNLEFVIPENKDGWQIRLTFNKPCTSLQVSNAKTKKIKITKGKVWILTNFLWNKFLKQGEVLKINIVCTHSKIKKKNPKRKVIAAIMVKGHDVCNTNGSTTIPTSKPTETITTENPIISNKPTETTTAASTAGGTCGAWVESGHSWSQGQNGKLFVTFPVDVAEWTVEVVLDRKINNLDVYQGVVSTEDGITYTITNMNYNGGNAAGTTLQLTWQAQFDDGIGAPKVVSVSLMGMGCEAPITTESIPSPPISTSTLPSKPTNCEGRVKYDESTWNQGLNGNMYITFNKDVMEWSFDVVFDRPINSLVAFNGIVTTEDGINFTVKNRGYNGKQVAGTELDLRWQARFDKTDQFPQILFVCGPFLGSTTESPSTTSNPPITTGHPTTTELSTTDKSSTTAKPSTIAESSTTAEPSTTAKPSTIIEPSTTAKPSSTVEPSTTTKPSSTAELSTNAKPSSTAEPSTTAKHSTTPGSTTEFCKVETKYDYNEVLRLSNLFYQAQRSGNLDALGDFNHEEIPYRGNSGLEDGSDHKVNLTGGYYDAGDYVKFNFPMAASTTLLAWGAGSYKSGYETANQHQQTLNTIRWATDYFIKCHTKPYELWGQVGDGHTDHSEWDRVEDMTIPRPSFKIDIKNAGSDLAGETAAALAAASIIFKDKDPDYSATLLTHAKELYEFADTKRGKYSDSISAASSFYKSWSGYEDELFWGAAWLYKATGEQDYLDKAEANYVNKVPNEFSWDDKTVGGQIILAQETGKAKYVNKVKAFCDKMVNQQRKTPKGLVFIQKWGSLRHASNVAFACLQAAQINGLSSYARKYREFAEKQINYALGDAGRSYVIGFGGNYPTKPHHRSSSCPKDPSKPCGWDAYNSANPNPSILWGALIGGPGEDDSYTDDRKDYIKNEVTCDYNAGFQSAVAGLRTLADEGLLPGNNDQNCGGSIDGGATTTPALVTVGPGVAGGNDKVTAYGDAWEGNNCGFIKMPSSHVEKYFVAMPNDFYNAGATCGVCLKLSTSEKSLITYGMNRCPECQYNPSGESHWDLSNSAYRFLIGEPLGIGHRITHEIVPCPENIVSGNLEIYTKDGSNPWWNAFQPLNFRIAVDRMSLSTDGGNTWTTLRGPGQHYVDGFYFLNDNINLSGSYTLRIHSATGNIDVDMLGVQAKSFVDTGKQN